MPTGNTPHRPGTAAFLLAALLALSIFPGTAPASDCPWIAGSSGFGPLNQAPTDLVLSGAMAFTADLHGLTVYDISDATSPARVSELLLPGEARAIALEGNTACLALEKLGVWIVDVSDPSLPVILGSLPTRDRALDLDVSGNILYVADGYGGLLIFDLSDPAEPSLVARYLPEHEFTGAVRIDGTMLHLGTSFDGYQVLDVSDPRDPVVTGVVGGIRVSDFVVDGSTVFTAATDGLAVIDVSDPSDPLLLGRWSGMSLTNGLAVSGSVAYLAGPREGLFMVDLTDLQDPRLLSWTSLQGSAEHVAVTGNTALVADSERGLVALDVSNPRQLPVLGLATLPASGRGVAVSGDHAYVADDTGGLQVVDISDPGAPSITGSLGTPGPVRNLTVSGSTAYLACGADGLLTVDVSNPSAPALLGSYVPADGAVVMEVVLSGNLAYLASSLGGLRIVDVSDPSTPTPVGSLQGSMFATGIALSGNMLLLAEFGGVHAVDVSNPSAPAPLWSWAFGDVARDVAVAGSVAYVSAGDLHILDLADPLHPVEMPAYDLPVEPSSLVASGTQLHVADSTHGLVLLGISDPFSPVLQGSLTTSGEVLAAGPAGSLACLTNDAGELMVLDVSAPTAPPVLGRADARGRATALAVSGTSAWIADGWAGLRVLDVTDPSNPQPLAVYDIPGNVTDLSLVGTLALVVDNETGSLRILDVTTPDQPVLLSTLKMGSRAPAVAAAGTTACVAGFRKVRTVDFSDPAHPLLLDSEDLPTDTFRIRVFGNLLFVSELGLGLVIYDLSDPADITRIATHRPPDSVQNVTVAGDMAYVAEGNNGLEILDISDPSAPVTVGHCSTGGPAVDTAVIGDTVLVLESTGMIEVIDAGDPGNPVIIDSLALPRAGPELVVDPLSGTAWLPSEAVLQSVGLRCALCNTIQLSADPTLILTGGAASTITLTTRDPFGDPVTGQEVVGSTSLGTLSPFVDNGDGSSTATLTSGEIAGTAEVGVTVNGAPCPLSVQVSIQCAAGTVDPPSDVQATVLDDTTLEVAWTPSPGAAGYRIFRGGLRIAELDPASSTFTESGLSSGSTYCYTVQSLDSCGGTADSAEVCTTTSGAGSTCPWRVASDPLGFTCSGGMEAVAIQGHNAFVAGSEGLLVFDLTDPSAPHLLGHWQAPEKAWDLRLHTLWDGTDILILADGASGIHVLDVSDPAHPHRIASEALPGFVEGLSPVFVPSGWGRLCVFAAAGELGVHTIDLGSVPDIWHASTTDTTGYARKIALGPSGSLWVADGVPGLQELGPAGPWTLSPGDLVPLSGPAVDVEVQDGLAFTAVHDHGLEVVDLDSFFKIVLGRMDLPGLSVGVTVTEGVAHVAADWEDLQIVDVSDPGNMTLLGSLSSPGAASDVAVAGGIACLTKGDRGLETVDVGDPTGPVTLGWFETPGRADGVALSTGTAWVATGATGLRVLDMGDPAHPTTRAVIDTPGMATGVAVAGGLVLVTDGPEGLRVYSADPADTELLASLPLAGEALSVTVTGNLALVAGGSAGLHVVDLSDPASPTLTASLDTPGEATAVAVSGALALVADGSAGLQVVDLSDPAAPAAVASLPTAGSARGVEIRDHLAYLADGPNGVLTIDLFEPSAPRVVGHLEAGDANGITLRGTTTFVADGKEGLLVVEWSDPTAPVEAGRVPTRGPARGVALSGGLVAVAASASLDLVTVECRAPEAAFDHEGPEASLAFTDRSLYGPSSWTWDFGDGSSPSDLQNPTHTWQQPGFYTVTLTAANAHGASQASTDVLVSTRIFDDVPAGFWAFHWINLLYDAEVTGGCSADPLLYCPDQVTTRGQMAVFLLASGEGPGYAPPPASGIFGDVPPDHPFAPWIEELARRGVTAGCSTDPPLYCPADAVTRDQMAVFLLASSEGPGYAPPPASGIFDDVPPDHPFAPWIEELARRGVTAGCSTDPPLYCPADAVTRDQMAVFLVSTFGIGR